MRPDRSGEGLRASRRSDDDGSPRAVVAGLRSALADAGAPVDETAVAEAFGRRRGALGHGAALAASSLARAELVGAGPLQPFLDDPHVTDVLVNGRHSVNGRQAVWIDRGRGLDRADLPDLEETQVRALATRLAAACGQRLDEASPVVDGRLPDGTRLHAVLPPISGDGTLISLRTLRRRALSMTELLASGTVGTQGAQLLGALVASRANVLVSGATGTGKTTLLAAMLSLVPAGERIVCIEEAIELNPDHPHVVHLQVRRPNVQGIGEIGLDQLVRAAMRMRPDRLVLGECRGAEVRDVLGALNTGHEGGWATVHANATADVPARLTALGALAGMDPHTVAAQAVSGLDAVVHLRRRQGRRWLAEVGVLERDESGVLASRMAARCAPGGELHEGPGWERLARRLETGAP